MIQRLSLFNTFDPHVHLRDPQFFFNKLKGGKENKKQAKAKRSFEKVVEQTIFQFGEAGVMPNAPAIDTPDKINWYEDLINSANTTKLPFKPFVLLKIGPQTTPEMIKKAQFYGCRAGKLYPDGVTTGSAGGVQDFKALYPVFEEMQECGMILSIHGEVPRNEEEQTNELGIKDLHIKGNDSILTREYRFHEVYEDIRHTFPKLKIILEHITDARTVEIVYRDYQKGLPTAATITVHHLVYDLDAVLASPGTHEGLAPHPYIKPMYKFAQDRKKLLWAAISGLPCFFFGSDTAPHYKHTKECSCGCAGLFNAPVALPMLAYVFETMNVLDKLQNFVSDFARKFYELPPNGNGREVRLVKSPWKVPKQIAGIVPMMAGKILPWKVVKQ